MKGINRRQHEALMQSLQQLETLFLARTFEYNPSENTQQLQHIRQALAALEQSYARYQNMLDALAFHIVDYEELYRESKLNCLGGNLKRLLKDLPKNSGDIYLLKESIHLAKAI